MKDPDTGKRLARLNPPSEWITKDVPELRIVDDELWQLTPSLPESAHGAAFAHDGLILNRSIFAVSSGMREATESNSAPIRCSCFAVG